LDCKEVVVESVSEGQSDLAKAPMPAIVVNEIALAILLQHDDDVMVGTTDCGSTK
jgi:hypothetical protein